jgi:lipopolysaccharide biosynthesis regulator YciM
MAALTWLGVLARVAYTTLCNYLVGLTPEENHWRKGEAWGRVGAYRWAAWHFRKYLTYSDDPRVRPHLAWCYANLGMLDSAVQHYRQAYTRNKHPDVALALAQIEIELGNVDAAQVLVQALESRRHELGSEAIALLDSLEGALKQTTTT